MEWFSDSFADTPVVLTQPQDARGHEAVINRAYDVTPEHVAIQFQEEEANDGFHMSEGNGYIAIETGRGYNNGTAFEAHRTETIVTDDPSQRVQFSDDYGADPLFVADLQTLNGSDTAGLRYHHLSGDGVNLFAEEERSADMETDHVAEAAGYLVFDDSTTLYADKPRSIGKVGQIEVGATDSDDWRSVPYNDHFEDPVVIMAPVSSDGGDPVDVRLRNVTASGFEFKLEEWGATPGAHRTERVGYLVLESGVHELNDTAVGVSAGTIPVQGAGTWTPVRFNAAAFGPDQSPMVFSQAQTYNGTDAVLTRNRKWGHADSR